MNGNPLGIVSAAISRIQVAVYAGPRYRGYAIVQGVHLSIANSKPVT